MLPDNYNPGIFAQQVNFAQQINRSILPSDQRYRSDVAPQVHQGATIQATSPIPGVSQPETAYYRSDIVNRITQRGTQHLFLPNPQTYIFPPGLPEFRYYTPDENRYNVYLEGPRPIFERIPQSTHPVPKTNVPEFAYYKPDINRYIWEGPEQIVDGPTRRDIFPPPPVGQATWWQLSRFDINRIPAFNLYMLLHMAADPPVPQTYIVPSNVTIQRRARMIVSAKYPPDGGSPVHPQSYVFGQTTTFRKQARMIVAARRVPEGGLFQQTYIFPPNQPELAYEPIKHTNRYQVEVVKRWQEAAAAIAPQWYVFPVNEPDFRNYVRNTYAATFTPIQGTTLQQTYIFPLLQPYLTAPTPSQQPDAARRPDQMVPTFIPHNIYTPNQPEISRFSAQNALRYVVDAPKRFEGITVQPTYIFPVSQPDVRSFYFYIHNRTLGTVSQVTGPSISVPFGPGVRFGFLTPQLTKGFQTPVLTKLFATYQYPFGNP